MGPDNSEYIQTVAVWVTLNTNNWLWQWWWGWWWARRTIHLDPRREPGGRRLTKSRMGIRRERHSSASVQLFSKNVQPAHISTYVQLNPLILQEMPSSCPFSTLSMRDSRLCYIFYSNFLGGRQHQQPGFPIWFLARASGLRTASPEGSLTTSFNIQHVTPAKYRNSVIRSAHWHCPAHSVLSAWVRPSLPSTMVSIALPSRPVEPGGMVLPGRNLIDNLLLPVSSRCLTGWQGGTGCVIAGSDPLLSHTSTLDLGLGIRASSATLPGVNWPLLICHWQVKVWLLDI